MERNPHERLLQLFSALLIQLNALQTQISGRQEVRNSELLALREGLKSLEAQVRTGLAMVRTSLDELPPAELEGSSLSEALSRLVEETVEALGLSSRVSVSGVDEEGNPLDRALPGSAERLLYLVAREALSQLQERVGTRRVRFMLNYGADDVHMILEDDAINAVSEEDTEIPAPPFTLDPAPASSPVMGDLRYRISLYGGSLEVTPLGERGRRVVARIPYIPATQEIEAAGDVPAVLPSERSSAPPQATVRILLVDNQAVIRAGLRYLIDSYADLHVVGEASDGVQAVSETLELGPNVVLMDSHLPNGQSLEALRQIKQLNLDTRVLLFSTQDNEDYLYETLRAGADGYILKDIAPDELAEALRVVSRGEVLIQPQLAGKLLSRFGRRGHESTHDSLTARELEVLKLLARGLRNKEIAARLYVSERTVNFHLANIYQKLNVSGRTEALSKALEHGLISA